MTRKMSRVNPVHINFCWNCTFDSGAATSGSKGVKGLMRSRNRTVAGVSTSRSLVGCSSPLAWVSWKRGTHGHSSCLFFAAVAAGCGTGKEGEKELLIVSCIVRLPVSSQVERWKEQVTFHLFTP